MTTSTIEVSARPEALATAAVSLPSASASRLSAIEEQTALNFQRRTQLNFQATIQQIIQAVAPAPGLRVLDAATGSGLIARQLADQLGKHGQVIALDEATRIEQAKQAAQATQVRQNVEWHAATPEKLPFEAASFDVVICALALHRLTATEFLAAAQRVLKTGGRLIIADEVAPVRYNWLRAFLRQSYFRFVVREQVELSAQFYQAETLAQMLCAAGFRQQTINVLSKRGPDDWAFAIVNAVK